MGVNLLITHVFCFFMDLADFLVWAKRRTYGSSTSEPKRLADGSKEYLLSRDGYTYRDRYFGGNPFIGEEVVFRDGHAIWSMNYYGVATTRDPGEVSGFLVKALGLVERKNPYRGPEEYVAAPWRYSFTSGGDIDAFWGHERITYDEAPIYWLRFHGGLVGT